MQTFNIILALVATAPLLHATTVKEKTEELKELWGNLKAYPTLYTETGKITEEDTTDMVDGTELWKSMKKVGDAFYLRYKDLLRHIPPIPPLEYYSQVCSNADESFNEAFEAMREEVTSGLHHACDDWKTTSICKDLTSRWIKAHDL